MLNLFYASRLCDANIQMYVRDETVSLWLIAALQIAVHDSDDEKHHSEGSGIALLCFLPQLYSSNVQHQ